MQRPRISINSVNDTLIIAKGNNSKAIERSAKSVWEIIQRRDW
jgi:hypothetical protein